MVPRPPAGLSPRGRVRWRQYWRSEVARLADPVIDRPCVERWIRCLDQYEQILPQVTAEPLVPGSMGQPVLNPLAGFAQQLLAEIRRAEQELGLTPLARLRLGITLGEARVVAARAEAMRAQQQAAEMAEDPRRILEALR